MTQYKKTIFSVLAAVLAAAALFLWLHAVLGSVGRGRTEEGRQLLENTLHRGSAAYYADRGVYPPTLEELTNYTGVQLEDGHYLVFYDAFAENLMPDITVLVNPS